MEKILSQVFVAISLISFIAAVIFLFFNLPLYSISLAILALVSEKYA